jgi:beta-fructofuranosidase
MAPITEETPSWPKDAPEDWLTYHLAHPGPGEAMPGDPNCALYYKGLYHLHYIYKHTEGFAFAHLSSEDMVRWKWHPTVLVGPNTGHGMFSGTAFFTREGNPAIIYHGMGGERNFLAFPLDDKLDKWTKPIPIEPKTTDGTMPEMRHWDPDCWLNGDTYYAISGGSEPKLMKSKDLKEWGYLGTLLHDDYPDALGVPREEDISCANMFKIGDKWMLLCISHTLGARYYLGDFKDEKYLPEFHALMSWNGKQFFAPESLVTEDGRRVMWAWYFAEASQSGIQSLPRELSLPEDGVLRIAPLRELEKLRHNEKEEEGVVVKSGERKTLETISGDTIELSVKIKATDSTEYGVKVFCDENGDGLPIAIMPERGIIKMKDMEIPFELEKGEELELRIFLDKAMVEIFANGRQAAAIMQEHKRQHTAVALFSKDGDILADVKAWAMKSIYS